MSVFASGAIPPSEAISWVCAQPNVEAIVFGASSRSNIRSTRGLVDQFWKNGHKLLASSSSAPFMKIEDTRPEITYLPRGSSTSFMETDVRYLGDSDKPPEREISIGYVLDILRRRRKIVLWVIALSFCAGLILALRPKTYLATGMLQVRPGAANVYKSQANDSPANSDTDDRIESEVLILQSKTLLLAVADELHLYADPSIVGKSRNGNTSASDPAVQA